MQGRIISMWIRSKDLPSASPKFEGYVLKYFIQVVNDLGAVYSAFIVELENEYLDHPPKTGIAPPFEDGWVKAELAKTAAGLPSILGVTRASPTR